MDNELNPIWEETFNFTLEKSVDASSKLTIEVRDYEKVGKSRPLGQVVVPLGPFLKKVIFFFQK